MLPQIIKDEIISQSPEMLILLEAIALRPSPSWHEDKRVEFCENWLKKAGCEGVYVDDEYNVIYPYHVTDDRPIVAFAAHTDVVFPDTDRFRIKEDAERIYCPGIYDDSVNLANILLAARLVTQHQFKPKDCGILFICDSCEEGMGNLAGMRKVFETYGKRIDGEIATVKVVLQGSVLHDGLAAVVGIAFATGTDELYFQPPPTPSQGGGMSHTSFFRRNPKGG